MQSYLIILNFDIGYLSRNLILYSEKLIYEFCNKEEDYRGQKR
jgi:hypothetical protein